jgi:hypothetical protein
MINIAASEMSDRTDRYRNIVISRLPFINVTKECNHHSIIDSFLKDNNINVDFSIKENLQQSIIITRKSRHETMLLRRYKIETL